MLYPSRSTPCPTSRSRHAAKLAAAAERRSLHGCEASSGRPTSGQERSGSERPMPRGSRYTTGRGPPGHVVSGAIAIDDVSPPGPPGRKIIGVASAGASAGVATATHSLIVRLPATPRCSGTSRYEHLVGPSEAGVSQGRSTSSASAVGAVVDGAGAVVVFAAESSLLHAASTPTTASDTTATLIHPTPTSWPAEVGSARLDKGADMADVQGTCDERFESVSRRSRATSTAGSMSARRSAVTLDGEPVVDIWGGTPTTPKPRCRGSATRSPTSGRRPRR